MKNNILALAFLLLAGAVLWGQHSGPSERESYLPLEMKAFFPREVSPGIYSQVASRDLQQAASEGWELVGVTPYIYRNEEHGNDNPKAIVTQTYPAYFFKRAKRER